MNKKLYFEKYENQLPYTSRQIGKLENLIFQFLGICTIISGLYYLIERWEDSINTKCLWFTLPLIIAENLSMIGTILFVITLWENKIIKPKSPVKFISEIQSNSKKEKEKISIDIFITTYNESNELLKYTVNDCKKLRYKYEDIPINIYLLDDGNRNGQDTSKENIKEYCSTEGIVYLSRANNIGYKAGNLRNGIEQSKGDIVVILDADTRVFPNFLNHTIGYFRNKKVAWVQTPQWFYDIPRPKYVLIKNERNILKKLKKIMMSYNDPLGNDTQGFYNVILQRRNYHNAAFCCGAGSLHRRSALMEAAVKEFTSKIKNEVKNLSTKNKKYDISQIVAETTITPFEFHASEDLCTSLIIHGDKENKWKSIQHPDVECKMLSTQNLKDKIKQHQRYAEGTLDIAINKNPLLRSGLSISQKVCYASTIWSYLSPLWMSIFILSPILYFFTLQSPINTNSNDVINYFTAFQIFNTITFIVAFWGIDTTRSEQFYVSGFWYLFESLTKIITGNKIEFHVTPKTKTKSNNIKYIIPHLTIITIGIIGIIYNLNLINNNEHPEPKAFLINLIWFIYTIWSFSAMIASAFIDQE